MSLWTRFDKHFPRADPSRFRKDKFFGRDNIMFVEKNGDENAVFDDDTGYVRKSIYYSDEMKKALGISVPAPAAEAAYVGFPPELKFNPNLNLIIQTKPHSFKTEMLTKLKIFVSTQDFFIASVRDIFVDTVITHYSSKEALRWLNTPSISYWPQLLNFAVWCATTGCGITQKVLFDEKLNEQVRSILWFHTYFTIRRILYELGGIQSIVALPGDSSFNKIDVKYDKASFERLCKEFKTPNTNFRFEKGANHGLGSVYVWFTNEGPIKTDYPYPGTSKFSDEGGKSSDGNLIQYIRNNESAKQYEYFISSSQGFTGPGLARLNQSIEALIYCCLGAQVNTRSSILGKSGSAMETQREFLILLESVILQTDISKSVQRFQLAIQEAKVRLDFAVSPDTWLLPSNMIINTESAIGYNNDLKKANDGMKLGVNSVVNLATKQIGAINMEGS